MIKKAKRIFSGGLSEDGSLTLSLSDAPIDAENVAGVYITINEIQYHLNDVWETMEQLTIIPALTIISEYI